MRAERRLPAQLFAALAYDVTARGVLTGVYGRPLPVFGEGDPRRQAPWFDADAWPVVYAGVERMKHVAVKARRPLLHLAIQWVAAQDGIASVLVAARDAEQARANAAAIDSPVDPALLDELTAVSDDAMAYIAHVA